MTFGFLGNKWLLYCSFKKISSKTLKSEDFPLKVTEFPFKKELLKEIFFWKNIKNLLKKNKIIDSKRFVFRRNLLYFLRDTLILPFNDFRKVFQLNKASAFSNLTAEVWSLSTLAFALEAIFFLSSSFSR